jgi:YfiH family protein
MEGMKFLVSPKLERVPGLIHGFGLRLLGTRAQAREAARKTFGEAGTVFFLRQVHGCTVATPPWTEPPDADASIAKDRGALLAIETADCLPVLIVDPVLRRVAAAHAGWRGTTLRVAQEGIRALVLEGSNPSELLVALGPGVGPCCYEVGPDVEAAFGPEGSRFFVPGPGKRKHLDLVAANRAQLEEAGVPAASIESLDLCTGCRADLFFSYRRDGASAGRMISVIGFSA